MIDLPFMNVVWLFDISSCICGCNLFARIFAMIFADVLITLIGMKSEVEVGPIFLGIRVIAALLMGCIDLPS